MGKTIIQTIGPLYGEVVNGTVFGRPNGSIFVPAQNTISASLVDSRKYLVKVDANRYAICNSSGVYPTNPAEMLAFVAESQDVANYVKIEIASDSAFTSIIGGRTYSAGSFNITTYIVSQGSAVPDLTNGDPYYIRAVLMAASNEPVATSATITVEGVAP